MVRTVVCRAGGLRTAVAFVVVTLVLALTSATTAQAAALSKGENKCAQKLGKAAGKLADAIIKGTSKCHNNDISGKVVGACPDAATTAKIDAATQKLVDAAAGDCVSSCSTTDTLTCLASAQCPPRLSTAGESCGTTDNPFEMGTLGFPGPFCETLLGHGVDTTDDIADCMDAIIRNTAFGLVAATYGSIDNTSDTSGGADKCLSSIAGSVRKLVNTTYKGIGKCRSAIGKGKKITNPRTCARDDAKLLKKIDKTTAKLRSTVDSKCSVAAILKLDLCGNGVGGTTTIADAQDCLVDLAGEAADAAQVPALRDYVTYSLVEAAYPPQAVCGDDMVNQLPSSRLRLGEECDGADDAACPGQCLPPGDLFECSCGDTPRHRFLADKDGSETDAGWTGVSHNQDVADFSGFVTSLENCDCSEFTDATCTGTSVDPVCDVNGRQLPVCAWDSPSLTSCDVHGNGDGVHKDADCYICDAFSVNAGALCTNSGGCQSQCHDGGGTPTGPCSQQSDCGAGDVCRGRCDTDQHCVQLREGGPQPVDTAGTTVCTIQTMQTNLTGTRNIVTGEHEIYLFERSTVHTGDDQSRPCPVCGGFCRGGKRDFEVCEGTCDVSGDPCRFDSDCPTGERCTPDSPDCPGGFCELSLVCATTKVDTDGSNDTGTPCAITYEHRAFGTLSHDCMPLPGANFAGAGLLVEFQPATSEEVTLPYVHACTAPGFELLECPCEGIGGAPTKPNNCNFACDAAGPEFGVGCADGNTGSVGTACAGGPNVGSLCNADTDCPTSTCSDNPGHCLGDPAFERFLCSTNAECGTGTCEDACPGGRCQPLCVPALFCDDAITICAANADCTGIGDQLCNDGDPTDGVCVAGPPQYRCAGERFTLKSCNALGDAFGASCDAVCSVSATPCTADGDCPSGEVCEGPCLSHKGCESGDDGVLGTNDDEIGAGICTRIALDCFLDPVVAEGGDTLNGQGDATNTNTVALFCQDPTVSSAINDGAGFDGPNRVRKTGLSVVNVPSIP